jgi:hypothetical protein
MSSRLAPIDGITDDDHSGVVIVYLVAAGCFSIFFTIIRFSTAVQKHLGFGADDAFFILSLVNLALLSSSSSS